MKKTILLIAAVAFGAALIGCDPAPKDGAASDATASPSKIKDKTPAPDAD